MDQGHKHEALIEFTTIGRSKMGQNGTQYLSFMWNFGKAVQILLEVPSTPSSVRDA